MGSQPLSFVGNLDWKDPQENSLTQKQTNQNVKLILKAEFSRSSMT